MNCKTHWFGAICATAILIVVGCRSQPPAPIELPEVKLTNYAGTPLGRAQTPPPDVTAANSLGLDIRAYLIAGVPGQIMHPFASGAKVITGSGDAPLLAVSSSLADARLGIGAEAVQVGENAASGALGPIVDLASHTAVLAPGISAQMRVSPTHVGELTSDFQDVELVFSRPAQTAAIRVALTRASLYTPPAGENQAEAPQLPQSRREMAITSVDYTEGRDLSLAVLVPVSLAPGAKQCVLFVARITSASDDPAHLAAVAAARRELAAGTGKAQSASYEELVMRSSLRAASSSQTRRAALVYLATQGQAPIFLDAALVADDAVLQQLADELETERGKADSTTPSQPLGWKLDRVAFEAMGKLFIEKKLSPELRAVLSKHAGEAGRNPASLEQLIGRTVSRKDLENRLIAENYIFLEDISPAARVRAYDWLNANGKAPPGYDPLGPVDQRRKTLQAAIEQMARSTSSGDGK